MAKDQTLPRLPRLSAFASEAGELNVIIDTPKGSRNKFKYDEGQELFKLAGVLPAGAVFPFDFGFVPSTAGEDGDPIDILVLIDAPTFPGCLVACRLIGVIEAEQIERDGKASRNDRLVAIAEKSREYADVRSLEDVPAAVLDEVERFFVSYNASDGKEFRPLARSGPERARSLLDEGERRSRPL